MDNQKGNINEYNRAQEAKSVPNTVLAIALTATVAILVLFTLTLVILQLKFKEPLVITLSDWVKITLPIVGGAIVTVFAFLGVDRLKNFDERQDRLTKELREDLHIQVENALKLMQPQINETYHKWEEDLNKKLSEYDNSFSTIDERIKKYDKIIGSVERLEEISEAIGNVEEARGYIANSFSDESASAYDKSQKTRILLALVERVKCGDIKGDSDDYHNLASELAKQNYFGFAADITKKGLEIFDDDIDLLSDYIFYSHKAGYKADVSDGLIRLEKIEKEVWNWRAFTFYIDVINDGEANETNKKKALQCVELYKHILPDEERAYMAEYQTLKKYGDLKAAENALIEAEHSLSMTAQCSLTLSEIYLLRGDFDKAINSATRAILGQAETQPSSNTGAAFAHRGFAKDAKVHMEILEGVNVDTLYSDIHSAINDYKMALKLGFSHANIRVRLIILFEYLLSETEENDSTMHQED